MKIEVMNIKKRYGTTIALNSITCGLKSGGLIGLVGPNGAGKSTLIKLLVTAIRPSDGDILLEGTSIIKKPELMRRAVGYLPQNVAIYPNLTATEFLSYMANIKGIGKDQAKRQIEEMLEVFHLADTGKKHLGGFSGGMRQRIGIITALLGEPQIVIVDEPTTGLDPQERITLRNYLSKLAQDRIVILSTHIVPDIEAVATNLLVLKNGTLAFNGSPRKILESVSGKVWEYSLGHSNQLIGQHCVSNMVQLERGIQIREISTQKPHPLAMSVEASLEDACLYAWERDYNADAV